MFDGEAFGKAVVAEVRAYLDRETAALRREITGLRDRLAQLEDHATAPDRRT